MTRRRMPRSVPGAIALTTAIVMGVAACSGANGATAAASSASSAAGTVVVHAITPPIGRVHTTIEEVSPPASGNPVPGTQSSSARQAQSFAGVPTVGPLFTLVAHVTTVHLCTAVVVHSTSGDAVMTAAHCVFGGLLPGYHTDLAFVPGYHDGQAPYGVWVPTSVVLDSRWVSSQNPDDDVAFVTLTRADGGTGTLEQLTGADSVRFNPPFTDPVDVIGYPITHNQSISCAAPTSEFSATQLQFDCGGYSDGVSGSPFIDGINPATGAGTVVGVLGGHDGGGKTSKVSFAAYPTDNIAALYHAAGGTG
jgi:V8-like Glu-specific endopeptidase